MGWRHCGGQHPEGEARCNAGNLHLRLRQWTDQRIQSAGADLDQNQAGESPCKHPQKERNAGRDRCYSGQRSRRL